MTQGILLFAHNSEEVNYGVMAVWMSERITRYLGKSVSLVTDDYTVQSLRGIGIDPKKYFDNVIINDCNTTQSRRLSGENIIFKNLDRVDAYDLTPYDETLVLDTDIAIMSDRLNAVWGSSDDILISNKSRDILDRSHPEFDYLKDHGIEFQWATEFYFQKSEVAEEFFNKCKHIRDNYNWYSILYGMGNYPVRNDHIWSIAIHESGIDFNQIPRVLRYATDKDEIIELGTDRALLAVKVNDNKVRLANVRDQDIHLMNKFELIVLSAIELGVML
jgi:hypothetical protein